jgi:hypothetical protein
MKKEEQASPAPLDSMKLLMLKAELTVMAPRQ